MLGLPSLQRKLDHHGAPAKQGEEMFFSMGWGHLLRKGKFWIPAFARPGWILYNTRLLQKENRSKNQNLAISPTWDTWCQLIWNDMKLTVWTAKKAVSAKISSTTQRSQTHWERKISSISERKTHDTLAAFPFEQSHTSAYNWSCRIKKKEKK